MSTLGTLAGNAPPDPPKRERPKIRGLKEGEWIDVIPYSAHLDPNASLFLPWLWNRLKEDGLVELYFPEGKETGFASFVGLMSSNVTKVVLVVVKGADGLVVDTVGIATWDPLRMGLISVGIVGFIFLRDYWEQKASALAAQRIMKLWFDDLKLEILLGLIAKDNHLANRFVQRVGWTLQGTLPRLHSYMGAISDANMWTITKDEFERTKGGE